MFVVIYNSTAPTVRKEQLFVWIYKTNNVENHCGTITSFPTAWSCFWAEAFIFKRAFCCAGRWMKQLCSESCPTVVDITETANASIA